MPVRGIHRDPGGPNGDGILHILGSEMPCWGTLGVVIAHRQPSQSFDARSTSAVEYARVS